MGLFPNNILICKVFHYTKHTQEILKNIRVHSSKTERWLKIQIDSVAWDIGRTH